mgnify:CR=1 FL=1
MLRRRISVLREGSHPHSLVDLIAAGTYDPYFRYTEQEEFRICRGYKINRFIKGFKLGQRSDRGTLFCEPSV